ncbi:MAG: chaperonin GroEL [Candidatus Liberibacter ctenarytainae]|uniref:Chaperonin GroEL n=1 Tax=Candidatus Liberibacter ctenarytainae TaxID=2020335 RepID=A0A937AFD9_9HYPH|nr:chaperonin GroEL [Candidatus Liberibacter ctenarytainae]
MSAKDVRLGSYAQDGIAQGVNILADAVKCTLGPRGKYVVIGSEYGQPRVTKDGVFVAKNISLKDPLQEVGARMIRSVATSTNDRSGDGTTTASCLAQAIINEGRKAVTSGRNPMDLKRGIEAAVKAVVETLKGYSKKVETHEEIVQVATISANGNREIGKNVAHAIEQVGPTGVVTLETAKTADTTVNLVEGMQFERGFISPYFITNSEKMCCEIDDPHILICDKKIGALQPILNLLETIAKSGRSLLIIAEDVEGEALATLVVNRLRGGLPVFAVKAPAFGDRRKQILQDIAVLVGATFVSDEIGVKLEKTTLEDLGSAKKVIITKDDTTIVGGIGDQGKVQARVKEIQSSIEVTTSDYDRDKLKERLAKLSCGVAVVHVGEMTEAALNEKKECYQDSIDATRAAIDEGIVAGGGTALLRASQALSVEVDNDDQAAGVEILRKALVSPCHQIAKNAGEEAALIVGKIKENENINFGYDAQNCVFGDMFEKGIVDPMKVVRNALQSAASVASMLLITGASVTDFPKDESSSSKAPAGAGGMPGMGGMGGMDMM